MFKFTKAILEKEKIQVFNFGNHKRDFTYIDDIIEGVVRVLDKPAQKNFSWDGKNPDPGSSLAPWRIYNIGNNNPVNLMDYISTLEKTLNIKAEMELLPLQDGDVPDTFANVEDLVEEFNYKPSTSIEYGIKEFVSWYIKYFKIDTNGFK